MDMFKDRNLTAHTYNEDTANEITDKIISRYYSLFLAFEQRALELADAGK